MIKRFMDSDIFKKQWFRKLSNNEKTLWLYITTNCSYDGFFDYDDEVIKFYSGFTGEIPEIIIDKLGMVYVSSNEYFLHKWVRFQYGELKINIKPHKRIIKRIFENNLQCYFPELSEVEYESY